MATAGEADLVRLIDGVLRRSTNLSAELVSAGLLAECRGRLACMVRRVRPDWDREPARDAGPRLGFLLVISVIPEGATDHFSIALVDTDRAIALLRRGGADQGEEERRIVDGALVGPEEHVEISERGRIDTLLSELVLGRWNSALEASGHVMPYGRIAIRGARAGTALAIDDRELGVIAESDGGALEVEGVTPGVHRIGARHPEALDFSASVEVVRAKTSSVSIVLVPRAGAYKDVRAAVFWGGVGTAIAGVAIVAYAISSGGVAELNCWGTRDCPSSFRRFGAPGASGGVLEDPAGGGLPIAPLGYSLGIAGVTVASGTYFFGDDRELPWLPVAIGVAAGALSFALSAALDPSNAVERARR